MVLPGNFPFFRTGTNGFDNSRLISGPIKNPLESRPTTTSKSKRATSSSKTSFNAFNAVGFLYIPNISLRKRGILNFKFK